MSKDSFISELINKIDSTNLSIFLGAGMSRDAGLPSWKVLFKDVAKQVGIIIDKDDEENKDKNIDYYQIAQYCENKLGKADLRNKINKLLSKADYEKSNSVKSVVELPADSYWTTNFDRVLDRALENKYQIHPNIIYRDCDLTKSQAKTVRTIYKMNGHIDDQASWVLTKRDLERYCEEHEAMLTFFKRELVINTFLFLGYSFTDTLVLSALRDVRRYLGDSDSTHYHYTILPKKESEEFNHFVYDLEKSYGIKTLIVEKDSDVIEIINELNNTIKKRQIFISGAFRNIPQAEIDYSALLAKNITEGILKKGYKICSGIGAGIGHRIVGYASEWLLENNYSLDKKLILRSRSFHNYSCTNDTTKEYRRFIMNDSGIALFIFGNGKSATGGSDGVRQEFEVAKETGMKIIPLGVTGYETQKIWQEIKSDISNYGYLEKYIDRLNEEKDPEKLTKVVLQIIDDIQ
jgi:predicted regulator of amino acid metabolism with ACT domain